jgi:DNA-binding NtrC family response regulator
LDGLVVEEGLEGWTPLELLERVQCVDRDLPVVFVARQFRHAAAIELRRAGAFEVVPEGLGETEWNSLMGLVRDYRRKSQGPTEVAAEGVPDWRRMLVGQCAAMERIADVVALVAPRRSTILITGETGTGKEVAARAIHLASKRPGRMVSLNCTALPESLLEAELFGHTKGAFTGAQGARTGLFESAQKGTVFLDEIGDMPLDLQSKLLRVLQEREIQRLGSSETIPVDVRVIAATNVDLQAKIEDGRFREDLFFRLNVVPLHLPALRERPGDIGLLAEHFVRKICQAEEQPVKRLTRLALLRLEDYAWPGNVRELENIIERAIAMSGEREELMPADFGLPNVLWGKSQGRVQEHALRLAPLAFPSSPVAVAETPDIRIPEGGIDFEEIVARMERNMIEQALRRTKGNKSAAADLLRLKRTTLGAKLRTLGPFDLAAAC